MVDEIRRNLDKATGDLIESFIKFDKTKAMQLKIGLQAIHNAQKTIAPENKINLYAVCDYNILHKLLAEHGIPRDEFDAVPAIITEKTYNRENIAQLSLPLQEALLNFSEAEKPDYNVPTRGMVAVMFNMVQEKVKNALIAGQSGERTLKAIERAAIASPIRVTKELALRDTLYDYGNKNRLARAYIDNSSNAPDYLICAKATHHLADLFESSIKLHPITREFETIIESMYGFNKLAAGIFRAAACNLSAADVFDASAQIEKLANHVESEICSNKLTPLSWASSCATIKNGMDTLRKTLHSDGIITNQEAADYEELVAKRLEQIEKVELV